MAEHKELFSVRVEGSAVGVGRMRLDSVIKLLEHLNRALYRTGRQLQSEQEKPNKKKVSLRERLAVDLVAYSEGSRAVLMKFDGATQQTEIQAASFLRETAAASFQGLHEIQGSGRGLPRGFSPSVLLAWRNVGQVFERGVDQISIQYRYNEATKITKYTPAGYASILDRLLGSQVGLETFEGRLNMADFKEQGNRLRIHPDFGEPVICEFDDEKADDVLGSLLKRVRITGPTKKSLLTGRIEAVQVLNIEQIEEEELTASLVGISGDAIEYDFWKAHSLADLHGIQGLSHEPNLPRLLGTWPGASDDGFEEFIDARLKEDKANERP